MSSSDYTLPSTIPDKTILVIFGASGDLTRRKLMPALYHLSRIGLLPAKFAVIGLGRRIQLGEEFKIHMQNRVRQYCSHKMEKRYWDPLEKGLISLRVDYKKPETFSILRDQIKEIEDNWQYKSNRLFYFATSPSHFDIIIQGLASVGLNHGSKDKWTRLIIEKPFGLNLSSADLLNEITSKYFVEEQIFRIDHFLGKEAVQNLLVFRMSNIIFQPLWNRDFIDHIQITSSETIGVEGRVEFFEQTGAIRDMVQSHLLQLLAFLTMEHPESLNPEEIRDQKVLLLKSVRKYKTSEVNENALRAQYEQGVVNSELVVSYIDEKGVKPNSQTETFAILRLFIDNYRWRGVPIFLRTGKRMRNRKTEILIQLKETSDQKIPTLLISQTPIPNYIRLEIQPSAGVEIKLGWKPVGLLSEVEPINLHIGGTAEIAEPKAYERLIVDAMRGDSTLFVRYDEIREMWKIVDPILSYWREHNQDKQEQTFGSLFHYHAGSQGPIEAKEFIERFGVKWRKI